MVRRGVGCVALAWMPLLVGVGLFWGPGEKEMYSKAVVYPRPAPEKHLVVAGGMTRAGSTFQFNVLRLLLESASVSDFVSGYEFNVDWKGKHAYSLLKCHNCTRVMKEVEWDSVTVFTIHRDLRDVCASSKQTRVDGKCIRLKECFEYYSDVARKAHVDWQYEDVIADPNRFVMNAVDNLNRHVPGVFIKEVNATNIVAQINAMVANLPKALENSSGRKEKNGLKPGEAIPNLKMLYVGDKSQFFVNHRSNGSWGSFKKALTREHCIAITKQYKEYFDEFLYPGEKACMGS